MITALAILGVLLGFSIAVNIILFAGYRQEIKDNERLKHEAWRHDLSKRIAVQVYKFEDLGD